MKNKGVTLISLVVTIIVLLILAGITIGTIFNDNGIIKKAQEAANATEEAAKNDQAAINGLLNEMDSIINGTGGGQIPIIGSINGKITWSTGSATLTLTTDVEGVTIQYRKNSESNWTNYTSAVPSLLHGDKVYARGVKGGETVINEKEFKIQDTIAPTVTIANTSSTTNSISATATATDNEAGMGSNPQYTFYIKKTTEADSAYTQIGSSANTSVIKGELEQNTSYTIKVEVADVAGNKGQATKEITTGKIADAGEGLTNGAIIASSPVWSNGTASITLSTSSGLTIQYQKGGISGSWTTGTNVTGLHHNDTVYARLTDGINNGNYASVDIVDNISPTVNISITSVTSDSIKVKVTASDGQSGLATSGPYKYYLDNKLKTTTISNTYTFTSLEESTTYTLKVTVADNAGKTTTKSVSAKTESDETIAEAFNNGTIKIGDYVKYTPNGANSYNVLGTQSGFLDDNDNLINQTITRDNLNWRVFDIKNGNVRLISETATNSEIGFSGANGYNNAVYIVNDACSTLYRGNNATATNLNNEDIYEKLDTSIWDYTQSQYYGQVYTTQGYSYPNIFKKETNQPINNYSGTLKQNEQPSIVTGYTTGSSLQIKVTTWETAFEPLTEKNYKNSIYFDIIQNAMGRNKAWLASRGVGYQGGTGFFEVNYLTVEGYDYQILYNTSNQSRQKECSLRPIITLNSSVKIITSDKVNDGSSASKAWQIK